MYDNIAYLIKYGQETIDEYGNEKFETTRRKVFVEPRTVYASEFYNAAQVGLKPSITFRLSNRTDYDGENVIEFEGTEYDVIRTDWKSQRDAIDLICEERVG